MSASLSTPATVPTRPLGKDGPQVSALGFGAMGLSAFYGAPASDEERFKVLDRAYELGCTFWDSADIYMDRLILHVPTPFYPASCIPGRY